MQALSAELGIISTMQSCVSPANFRSQDSQIYAYDGSQKEGDTQSDPFDGACTRPTNTPHCTFTAEYSPSLTSDVNPVNASGLLSLPVDVVEENMIPRIGEGDLVSLSATCKALWHILAPRLLENRTFYLPDFAFDFEYGSPVDALITFTNNVRQFRSSAAVNHAENLVITFTESPPRFRRTSSQQRRSQNWERRAMELIWPCLSTLSIQLLVLDKLELLNPDLDAICSMHRLKALRLDDCRIDIQGPLRMDPNFGLSALFIGPIQCSEIGVLTKVLCSRDLEYIGVASEDEDILACVLLLAPFPHLVEADIVLSGAYTIFDLLRIFPNIVDLSLTNAASMAAHFFPLPPCAYPCLMRLKVDASSYIHSGLVSRPLQALELLSLDETVIAQLTQAWAEHPSVPSGLNRLLMKFEEHTDPQHIFTFMDTAARRCDTIQTLTIEGLWMDIMDFVQDVNLPASIRHCEIYLAIWRWRDTLRIFWRIGEIIERFSTYQNLEYLQIGPQLIYDQDVYGQLSNEKCRAEFLRSMQSRHRLADREESAEIGTRTSLSMSSDT